MDFPATQICEDNDFTPTQTISHSVQEKDVQIGVLRIGSNTYPIKKGITVIGRYPDCDIILNNQTVSKKHAEIEASGSGTSAWICDLNSSNKTKLNNSLLRPHRCYELKNGNVLEFGVIEAVYNVYPSMDESLIPETPAPTRQKAKTIIPGTPDSSLNNSSTCEETSIVAGTQANNTGIMFRRPAVPRKPSMNRSSIRKSDVQNSSIDDSLDNSQSFARRTKRNVGESSVSIHDMETQKSFETSYEASLDIHDAETQKICVSKMIKDLAKSSYDQETNIHDVETQHEEDIQKEIADIHDLETQHEDIDIHDMETPKNIRRNVTIRDYSIRNSENIKAAETPKDDVNKNASCSNDADKDKIERVKVVKENLPKASQEYFQLSLTSNFEDEHSELDKSRNLIDPQSLLEDFSEEDESSLGIKSERLSPVIATSMNNDSDESRKSSDDGNIFDAPTQVSRIDENSEVVPKPIGSKLGSISNDSDSTDEEVGVLQNYSYIRSKDNEKSSKNQASDSEDSSTDEEGQFTEMALKIKRLSSSNLEEQANESKEAKTDLAGVSRDSEDLFDTLTQPVNLKKKSSLSKQSKDEVVIDFDAPTQVIDKNRAENNVEANKESTETKEIDDVAPTQVILLEETDDMAPTQVLLTLDKSSTRKVSSATSTGNKGGSNEEDITEMEDDSPTQIICIVEKDSSTANTEVPNRLNPLKALVIHEYSIENVEYEMAPTQRISEIEEQLSPSGKNKNVSRESKVSLNDSVEKNLKEMFDGINEEHVEERPKISTQDLENLLQSSQCEDKSIKDHVDSASPTISKPRKSIRGRKSKAQVVSKKMLCKSNLENIDTDNDSQNTDNYFSVLTSARKRNILTDSQDLPGEEKSNEQKEEEETSSETVNATNDNTQSTSKLKSNKTTESVSEDQSGSASVIKGSSTPRLSRKTKELKASKDVPEEVDISKTDNDKLEEYKKSMDTKASSSSVDGEKVEEASKMLINEDDIFAGLPEVRISGTLSNPPSPASSVISEYNVNVNRNRAKQTVRIAPKKRGAPRKSQKRLRARSTENVEPCHTTNKANSSTILKSLSNPFSSNFDGNEQNDNEKTDKMLVESMEMGMLRRSSRRSKPSDLLPETKSITSVDSKEKGKQQSSFIRSNGRACNSSKENVDSSSVFQVEKEALTETAKSAKQNVLNVSRVGKRSLNTMDKVEVSDSKKRKEEVKNDVPATTRSKRRSTIADRRQSGNILDFVTKVNSPICQSRSSNMKSSQDEAMLDKQAVIRIVRMPSIPAELTTGNGNNTVGQSKPQAEEISSEIGEESQEIEMILNGSLNTATRKATKKNTKGAKKRGRKVGKTNVSPISGSTESSSASSIVYESDNVHFEAPTSKPKRAKVSRNTSSAVNSTINESSEEENKNYKRSTRSTRSIQKLSMDSSVKENTKTIANESVLNDTNKMNNSRDTRQRQKAGKVPANKKQKKETFIEETTSSEMDSSIETLSIPSTPHRTRSSLSSSFITSSPGRTKHRILFTGIPVNEYSKLITKLGATQVEDVTKCTVLVTDKVRRTVKFLCALAQSIPIVSVDWLTTSEKAKHFVELENYILKDSEAEVKYGFRLKESLEKAKNHKLLDGYTVVLTRDVVPPPSELKSIIAACGGKTMLQRTSQWPQKAVVISRKEDLSNAKKLLVKAPKSVTLQSPEFILTGILRQELNFTEFKLK